MCSSSCPTRVKPSHSCISQLFLAWPYNMKFLGLIMLYSMAFLAAGSAAKKSNDILYVIKNGVDTLATGVSTCFSGAMVLGLAKYIITTTMYLWRFLPLLGWLFPAAIPALSSAAIAAPTVFHVPLTPQDYRFIAGFVAGASALVRWCGFGK